MELMSCEETISDKVCADCNTSNTPLWRNGPYGPKSLCNACGIRYRKKRSSVIRSDNKKPLINFRSRVLDKNEMMKNGDLRKRLRINVVAMGRLQRKLTSPVKTQGVETQNEEHSKKYGEVEEAAFLLMSLSCGFVFA